MRNTFLFLVILLMLSACKEIGEFYLGIPLQPKFEENSFTPGLNIFGILNTDSTGSFNNSFIVIEKVLPAVGKIDSFNVDTVLVTIENNNSNSEQLFLLTNFDETFSQVNYRPVEYFAPKPGEIYSISCVHSDFPTLRATTIIPAKAVLETTSIIKQNNFLSFEIKPDTSIYMMDVYCYIDTLKPSPYRFAAETEQNTLIEIPVNGNKVDSVVVYSYDYNMAKYYLTSNTSLNFNKYRNSYSTVENGYGVFGSINKNCFKIK